MFFQYTIHKEKQKDFKVRLLFQRGFPFDLAQLNTIFRSDNMKTQLQVIKYSSKQSSQVRSVLHNTYQLRSLYSATDEFHKITNRQERLIIDFFCTNTKFFYLNQTSPFENNRTLYFQFVDQDKFDAFDTLFKGIAAAKIRRWICAGQYRNMDKLIDGLWSNEGKFCFQITPMDRQDMVKSQEKVKAFFNSFFGYTSKGLNKNADYKIHCLSQITSQIFMYCSKAEQGQRIYISGKKGVGKSCSFRLLVFLHNLVWDLRLKLEPSQYRQYYDSDLSWDYFESLPKYIYIHIQQRDWPQKLCSSLRNQLPYQIRTTLGDCQNIFEKIQQLHQRRNMKVYYIIDNINYLYLYPKSEQRTYYYSQSYYYRASMQKLQAFFNNIPDKTFIFGSFFHYQSQLVQKTNEEYYNQLKHLSFAFHVKDDDSAIEKLLQMIMTQAINKSHAKKSQLGVNLIQPFQVFKQLALTKMLKIQDFCFLYDITHIQISYFLEKQWNYMERLFKRRINQSNEERYIHLFKLMSSAIYQSLIYNTYNQGYYCYQQKSKYLQIKLLTEAYFLSQNHNIHLSQFNLKIQSIQQVKKAFNYPYIQCFEILGNHLLVRHSPRILLKIRSKRMQPANNSLIKYLEKDFELSHHNMAWFAMVLKKQYLKLITCKDIKFRSCNILEDQIQIDQNYNVLPFTRMLSKEELESGQIALTKSSITFETSIFLRFMQLFGDSVIKQLRQMKCQISMSASCEGRYFAYIDQFDIEDQIIDYLILRTIPHEPSEKEQTQKNVGLTKQEWNNTKIRSFKLNAYQFCISFDFDQIKRNIQRLRIFYKKFRQIQQLQNQFEGKEMVDQLLKEYYQLEQRYSLSKQAFMHERYQFQQIEHSILMPKIMLSKLQSTSIEDHEYFRLSYIAIEDLKFNYGMKGKPCQRSTIQTIQTQITLFKILGKHLQNAASKIDLKSPA